MTNEIFRFISSKVDENYEIWILTFNSDEEMQALNFLPDCMYKNIIFYNRNIGLDIFSNMDKDELIVLTNDESSIDFFKNFNFQNVYEIKSYMKSIVKYPVIDMVDFIFAFGFDELNFIEFCKENQSRGIVNSNIVYDLENPLTLSFYVDNSKSYQDNEKEFNEFSISQINSGFYSVKKDGNIMGVIYQGYDEELAIESELPLLYL